MRAQQLRITIVAPSLLGGGAERSIVLLTEGLLLKGHDVTVATLHGQDTDLYNLPAGAVRLALGIAADSRNVIHGCYNNLRRLRVLRRAIRGTRPDVVVSHMCQTNVITAVALAGSGYPVVAVEHSDPATNARGLVWQMLRRITYPQVAKVVSVSEGISGYFSWLTTAKRTVIHNPVKLAELAATSDQAGTIDRRKHRVIAMGRLIYVKGFDRLLSAFKQIADKHPDWELVILGEGQLRSDLEQLRASLGLTGSVRLPGFSKNPFDILRAAQLYVMSSRSEGFPYALLEAMSCGLPAIAMDCESGPREIIRDGVDGILVPAGDVDGLADALDRLMTDKQERQSLAAHAPEVLFRFGLETTIARWETLFAEVVKTDGK
jgi:glycosyltransferase involved in cell wall biosynthesis